MNPVSRRELLRHASIGAAALAAPAFARAQPAMTLRISSSLTADMNSSHFVWFDRFSKTLKAGVGDKLALSYFPNNQLGKESDVVQQVRLGAVGWACTPPAP